MAEVSAEAGVQAIASGNINSSPAMTIIVPAVVAGYGLYKSTWGNKSGHNPGVSEVLEEFVVPLGFGWTAGYLSARYGGLQNPVVVGLIAGAGVYAYNYLLMADVDKYVNKDL